ncbi:MAG: hypothetical protein FWG98_04010 [Candidatus Cloacimonetes bacterium]|nr:hypothetical protein [Candidatus Cloacimonadota bacterium]
MKTKIMGITIKNRKEKAVFFQSVLTEYGSYIQTRLGTINPDCSDSGIIILQIHCSEEIANEMAKKLEAIEGILVSMMDLRT